MSKLALVLAAAALLMIPVWWNGFPFIFFDSGDYLAEVMTGHRAVYRDPVYGFVAALMHGRRSLWGIAVGQSLLTAWLLFETAQLIMPRRGRAALFLAIVAVLASCTSLPWFSGQVMPDILGALAVSLVFLLAFGRMSPRRRWALTAILAVAFASHLTFLPLGLACLTVLLAARPLLARHGAKPVLGGIAVALAAAPALIVAANLALGGPLALSQTGHAFLLARLVQDGLAKQTLDRLCPDPALTLCAVKDSLPPTANDFLWGDSEAFERVGGWLGSKPEADRIIVASLRLFPLEHAASAARLTGQQLTSFATGEGLQSQAEPWGLIDAMFPGDLAAYVGARQQTDSLPLIAINRLHQPLAALCLCLLPVLIWLAWRRRQLREVAGLALIVTALLSNAVICAVLSNPNDRYESRFVWLAVLAATLAGARGLTTLFRPGMR